MTRIEIVKNNKQIALAVLTFAKNLTFCESLDFVERMFEYYNSNNVEEDIVVQAIKMFSFAHNTYGGYIFMPHSTALKYKKHIESSYRKIIPGNLEDGINMIIVTEFPEYKGYDSQENKISINMDTKIITTSQNSKISLKSYENEIRFNHVLPKFEELPVIEYYLNEIEICNINEVKNSLESLNSDIFRISGNDNFVYICPREIRSKI